jgi:HPt (histidine-containing phosphotransfer) domain-containing protein
MSDDQPIIDYPEALARTLGDVDFLKSMLAEFQQVAPDFMRRFQSALQAGDLENLAREAHQFKGSAANLGIKIVASIALKLEKLGLSGNSEGGAQLLDDLNAAVNQFSTHLEETDFSSLSKDK